MVYIRPDLTQRRRAVHKLQLALTPESHLSQAELGREVRYTPGPPPS